MAGTPITFDSHSLQTDNIITSETDHNSSPENQLSIYTIAHANKRSIADSEYPDKRITVKGQLVADNIALMDALEDTFKGYLIGENKYLDIGHGGSTRRYIVTPVIVNVDRRNQLAWANFTLVFECKEPFGFNTTPSNVLNDTTGNTTAPALHPITFTGNAPWQKPIITITLGTVTGATGNRTLSIGNDATGQVISITGDFFSGDVIVIDSDDPSVEINNIAVAFTGALPEFMPGPGDLSYDDDFLTRDYDISVDVTPRWM